MSIMPGVMAWLRRIYNTIIGSDEWAGTTWYVGGLNASDTNVGNIASAPFATLTHALGVVVAGDRILVNQGTYDGAHNLAVAGVTLILQSGVVLRNTTPGTVLFVSGANCTVHGGTVSQAGQIGLRVTGAQFRAFNVLASQCATGVSAEAYEGYFQDCQSRQHSATGFAVLGPYNALIRCDAHGTPATRGFYLNHTDAHWCLLYDCNSINNSAAGYELIAGADENVVSHCNQSELCGGPVDAGANNTWIWYEESQIAVANSLQQDMADIHTDTSSLPRALFDKTQWSQLPTVQQVVGAVAADEPFENIVFPAGFLPTGAVPQDVRLVFNYRLVSEDSGNQNSIGAANKTLRVKKSTGAWGTNDVVGITFANGQMTVDANSVLNGQMIEGDVDVSSEVDDYDNVTYNVRSEETNRGDAIVAAHSDLTIWDAYVGLKVYFTLS